jgi:hypothetical protein
LAPGSGQKAIHTLGSGTRILVPASSSRLVTGAVMSRWRKPTAPKATNTTPSLRARHLGDAGADRTLEDGVDLRLIAIEEARCAARRGDLRGDGVRGVATARGDPDRAEAVARDPVGRGAELACRALPRVGGAVAPLP